MTSRPHSDDDHSLFASKTPHFFKVILEEAIRDGKLEIPRNFVRKHGKILPSPVQLEVPSGAKWQVELTKCDEMVWLQKGWQEFAEHYSLKFGYFVVFRYEGNAHFRVLIFDKSASEIEYPYTSTDDDDDGGDLSVKLSDDDSASRKSKEKSHLPCPRPHKKIRTDSPNHPGTDLKSEILASRSSADDSKSRKMKLESLKKIEKSRCSRGPKDATKRVGGITGPRTVKTEALNCVRRLTATEKAHSVQRASAFKSTENPAFVVIMQPSHFRRRDRLYIPVNFSRKYFIRQNRNLTLRDSTGKTWPAKYSLSSNSNRQNPRIHGGWRAFAGDRNLNVGDICVFELIKQPDIVLKVVTYPVDQDASKACRPLADGSISGRAKIRKNIMSQIGATKGVGGITSSRTVKIEVLNCVRQFSAAKMVQAVQIASAFKTENPAFVVVMPPSSVCYQYRMSIPVNFARKYFTTQNRDLALCDSTGKTWPAMFSLNSKIGKQNAQILGGWQEFVEDNNLNVGDICVFELIKHPDILLKVAVYPADQNTSKASRPRADGSIATKGFGGIACPKTVKTEVLNCVQRLAATKKAQAIQRASAFESTENPAFVVVMQPWNFFRRDRIDIPANFARKYFTRQDRNLTLCDSTGKTWPAKYSLSSKINKQTQRIHGGWRAFAEDHNLDVGDVCVFELSKHPDILLKVVIYPVDQNASKACRPPADGSISGRAKIKGLSSGTKPNHGQSRCQSSSREFKDSNIEENANLCRKSELTSKMEPLILTEKERAFIRASAFKSANPSFTVRMRPSYINGATLYIPCQFSHRYLKNNCEVTLRVSDGRTWTVDYKRKASSLQPKAEFLSNSLRAFVLDNNLKVGDICVFELIAENRILLEVAILSAAEIASYSSSN